MFQLRSLSRGFESVRPAHKWLTRTRTSTSGTQELTGGEGAVRAGGACVVSRLARQVDQRRVVASSSKAGCGPAPASR
jgi:hypothetical protein